MIHLLKEVGRGKRGARDLTYEEALEAAEAIMNLQATPAQIGAFFIAERIKMESVEEIEAFVTVCRSAARRVLIRGGSIDCAGPYDGRKKTFLATFATAFVLAAAGQPVTLHGAASLPPKWGITLQDMLQALGIDAERIGPDGFVEAARETGILYAAAEQWCPPLARLRSIREELGMRTVLNTAEKLIDYSRSPYLVFGVYHNTVIDRLCRMLSKLSYRKAMIVQGPEGSEDLFIERPTRVYLVEDGVASLHVVNPESIGLDTPVPELDWTPALQVKVTENVLRGKGEIGFVHQVQLNAAYRLFLSGRADSVEEGLYTAKALLDSGAAWNMYQRWASRLRA